LVKKIIPPYFVEYLITAVFENNKNSTLYKNKLLKIPQSIAWSSLNVRVQVSYSYKSSRVCGFRHINVVGFSGVPRIFFSGEGSFSRNFFGEGVQQIQLRTEGRQNGDLGAVAP
jgi:hypothetical protein